MKNTRLAPQRYHQEGRMYKLCEQKLKSGGDGGIGDSGALLNLCLHVLIYVQSTLLQNQDLFPGHTDTRFLWGSRPGCWKHKFSLQAPWLPPWHGPLEISVDFEKPIPPKSPSPLAPGMRFGKFEGRVLGERVYPELKKCKSQLSTTQRPDSLAVCLARFFLLTLPWSFVF